VRAPRLVPCCLALCLGAAAGCAADPAPVATILGVSPAALDPGRDDSDDLQLRIAYRDADGDLGGGEARVQDCRAADLLTRLPIPPIASAEAVAAGAPIAGELVLLVPDVAALVPAEPPPCPGAAPSSAAAAVFCVALRDVVGHEGPAACTAPIPLAAAVTAAPGRGKKKW
jgi:hypothetical protein